MPPDGVTYRAEENVIIGNTVLYGATSGRAFFRGIAGERFAVRNSGASAVVEGVGDHGCEYMTGGRVVVLGRTGRNFAAGMSGGLAFVLDEHDELRGKINPTMLDQIEPLDEGDVIEVRSLVAEHVERTGSPVGQRVLDEWDALLPQLREDLPDRLQARARRARAAGGREHRAPGRGPQNGAVSTGGEGFVTEETEELGAMTARHRARRPLMGELGGFLKVHRSGVPYKDAVERVEVEPYREFLVRRSDEELAAQGGRCMECGVPFCHNGCPLGNLIPDWNDLVYRGNWQDAIRQLHATNNFPEFTGRLCPAPCEAACVLEIREGDAVTIKQIENSIIDRAWERGLGRAAAAGARDRPQRRRRRRRPGRAWPPPSSCAAPATASCCSSATRPPAASCASACRTSRSRSASSSAASSSSSTRASSCAAASTSASTSPATSCAPSSTRSC